MMQILEKKEEREKQQSYSSVSRNQCKETEERKGENRKDQDRRQDGG